MRTKNDKLERYGKDPRDSFEDQSEVSEDEDDNNVRGNAVSQNYDYSKLDCSGEVKELFDFIDRFKPSDIDLDTKLKPFIPEYIPSVGGPDAFIKIGKPKGMEDKIDERLGVVVLDEPGPNQTDSASEHFSPCCCVVY